MSFILDALKKSEVERQRQAIPGLMDAPPAPPRPRFPFWAIALCALLAVNAVVLAVVLLHGSSAPNATTADLAAPAGATAMRGVGSMPPSANAAAASPAAGSAAATGPTAAPAPAAAQAEPQRFSPMDTAPTYAPEIPPSGAAPAEAPPAAPDRAHASRMTAEADAWRPPAHQADPILTHDANPADTEVLPSISEVNLSGQVPEMHIDVHVYATKASDRFVYINMRRYQEGQTLAEGPVLEHIRRDGVVLDYRGVRFLLPRQP
jgi:general secretion pathway protein B